MQELTFANGVEAVVAALDEDGGVIVHDFIASDVLAAFRADMRAAAEHRQLGSRSDSEMLKWFWGAQTMRFTRLASRSDAFFDILGNADFLAVADRVLLPNCKNYWMNTAQMMILAPGQVGTDPASRCGELAADKSARRHRSNTELHVCDR